MADKPRRPSQPRPRPGQDAERPPAAASPAGGAEDPGGNGTPGPGSPPPPQRPSARGTGYRGDLRAIHEGLSMLMGGMQLAFQAGGDEHCATVIGNGAPFLVESWCELAKDNEGVRLALLKLTEGGAWGQVIVASGMIAIPMMEHHGMYPRTWPNPLRILSRAETVAAQPVGPEDVPPGAGKSGTVPRGFAAEPDMTAEVEAGRRLAEEARRRAAAGEETVP